MAHSTYNDHIYKPTLAMCSILYKLRSLNNFHSYLEFKLYF